MHLPRVAAVALITGAVVIVGGGPATADPGLATDAGGSIEAGRPTAHASYRQTPAPVDAVEDDAPAALPVADGGGPVPATQCYSYLVGYSDGVAQYGRVCPDGSGG